MNNSKSTLTPLAAALAVTALGVSPQALPASGNISALLQSISGVRYGIPGIKTLNGISGSGAPAAYGTIDGFGSIYVNGVRFDTNEARIVVDGNEATEAELGVGMMVLVIGEVDESGTEGTASTVIYDDELEGPIISIETNADSDAKRLTVLGVDVIVERTGTVFEHVTFETLEVGDVVEVSGFPEGLNNLRATRVEKKADAYNEGDVVEVKGQVSALTDTQFQLASLVVDYSTADLSDLNGTDLVEGLSVEVYGTLSGDILVATEIETEENRGGYSSEDGDEYSLQGAIQNFTDSANFVISGTAIDATNAQLTPRSLVLMDGVVVEVEGYFVGDTLIATEIEGRRGDIEIEASISALDAATGDITFGLFGGEVTVGTDTQTQFDDDTDNDIEMTYADLRVGDFLEVEVIDQDGALWATRVDRDDVDDETIQAPLQSFETGLSLTLLGITFSVEGAEFEGRNGADVPADVFFQEVQVGDLLKVEDESPADGVADEVEFEFQGIPDGGIDFDDDDESEDENSEQDETEDSEEDDSSEEDSGEDDSDEEDSEEDDSGEEEDSEEEEESDDESGEDNHGSGG